MVDKSMSKAKIWFIVGRNKSNKNFLKKINEWEELPFNNAKASSVLFYI